MTNEIKLRRKQKIETMGSIRESIDELLVKANLSILQEISRDILKVELEDNILKRRLSRKLQARIDEVEDEDLLKQIEPKMQIHLWRS